MRRKQTEMRFLSERRCGGKDRKIERKGGLETMIEPQDEH